MPTNLGDRGPDEDPTTQRPWKRTCRLPPKSILLRFTNGDTMVPGINCGCEMRKSKSSKHVYKTGYDFDSVEKANAKCQQQGFQLCGKEDVIAGAKQNSSLQNVCKTGWTAGGDVGWYSVTGRRWCGRNNRWNTWRPRSGKASAHCCSSKQQICVL